MTLQINTAMVTSMVCFYGMTTGGTGVQLQRVNIINLRGTSRESLCILIADAQFTDCLGLCRAQIAVLLHEILDQMLCFAPTSLPNSAIAAMSS